MKNKDFKFEIYKLDKLEKNRKEMYNDYTKVRYYNEILLLYVKDQIGLYSFMLNASGLNINLNLGAKEFYSYTEELKKLQEQLTYFYEETKEMIKCITADFQRDQYAIKIIDYLNKYLSKSIIISLEMI